VHPRPACVERAARAGLLKVTKGGASLATEVGGETKLLPLTPAGLAQAVASAMDRRVEGLLETGVRAKQIASGSAAVVDACHRGEAELVLVACDVGAELGDLLEVGRAVSEGRGVAWGTKRRLGGIVYPRRGRGRPAHEPANLAEGPDVGVIAVRSGELAHAIRSGVHTMDTLATLTTQTPGSPRLKGSPQRPRGANPATETQRANTMTERASPRPARQDTRLRRTGPSGKLARENPTKARSTD
jgi:hypothetical protein